MITPRVLYCGDTSLDGAAAYLAGLMTSWGWSFTYVPSDRKLDGSDVPKDCSLFVLSDYPAEQIDSSLQAQIVEQVHSGSGLLMIGGWESFHGLGGNWDGTPIAAAQPGENAGTEDRRNAPQTQLTPSLTGCRGPSGLRSSEASTSSLRSRAVRYSFNRCVSKQVSKEGF